MLGRNDLCSCGSGKKYKKCCLNNDKAKKIVNIKVESAQNKYARLYEKLYNYSVQDRFDLENKKAREIFYVLNNDNINEKFERLFSTYFMIDHIMENKKVIAVSYYEENANRITQTEANVMRGLFDSYISVYSIQNKFNENVVLKDLLTNETIVTEDIKLLENFKENDIIIARVVNVEGVNILVDVTVSISESIKDVICNDLEKIFDKYKEIYKDIKVFLTHHTTILYRYIQQLLEPEVATYLQNQLKESKNSIENNSDISSNKDEKSDKELSVEEILSEKIEEDYMNKSVEFWKEYKNSGKEIKGSEIGWAAAIEYHIKKENNINETQTEIAKKYGISASTLGKRYKDLRG